MRSGPDGQVDYGPPCPKCRNVIRPEHQHFVAYFKAKGDPIRCPHPKCGARVDWWAASLPAPDDADLHRHWRVAPLVGARTATSGLMPLTLKPDEGLALDVGTIGVPPDAEILGVQFSSTVNGPPPHAEPAMLVRAPLSLSPFPRPLLLYGATHGDKAATAIDLGVTVTWLPTDPDPVPLRQLAQAAKHFVAHDYQAVAIPAQTTVETAFARAVHTWDRYNGRRQPRELLHGKDLQRLVLKAADSIGARSIPDALETALDELRDYRNDLAHQGAVNQAKRSPVDEAIAARFLVTAWFAYHYGRYVQDKVPPRPGRHT
jgi:hypothetical protein